MKKKAINNGVICISNNFVYSCPLKLDDNYRDVILGLFYNNYSMHYRNLFRSESLRKLLPSIQDDFSAGKLAADYGYVSIELKNNDSTIFLPEFFNYYQFTNTLNEIAIRDNYNYSLYNEINGYENNLIKASSNETSEFIKSIYSDLCYDATKGFIGYSLDRKVKAIKQMK
ncbi:MAG: hypothetical protein IKG40_04335 [Bacilli bacterium]|nr:hypothetical protein [Bacilli bacterium]